MRKGKIAVVDKECVACGNCVKYCPKQAILIHKGICAVVDGDACVGCGKCEKVCPAGTISVVIREEIYA
ncbi:NAD-dependent dihydropyrimidine dehydrogenase PreA subunit [Aequitasia blattaphilus]|uniref:Ferredoxin n=1 Tax=Aequitasia blattaphilus TaxID=2949332 RepID=A0ABT1EBX1_9FIRM|nr:4Fe-4S binding protein [Aequitasia blattaphilus]MCP1103317.1 4Fe-4S binding protein [Aequitasia blattaphilus]MCR8615957.1 4Fe-4S binding protein [Aequitasia blattaphilus]